MNITKPCIAFLILLFFGCQNEISDADSIVSKAIKFHGGDLYENCVIDFDFRGRHYTIERDNGLFRYHRLFADSTGQYHDLLSNEGFSRSLNGQEMDVEQSLAKRYSNSINSVAYFALLPFGLNDAAVNKEFLGEEQIKGEVYFKIRVSFSQEGGGEDFDDVFVYWFHKQNYRMDYFGYSYQTDGGGVRFRQAVKQREIGGILFADYLNYEASKDDDVSSLARQFEDGKLKLLSEIIQENIEAKKLK